MPHHRHHRVLLEIIIHPWFSRRNFRRIVTCMLHKQCNNVVLNLQRNVCDSFASLAPHDKLCSRLWSIRYTQGQFFIYAMSTLLPFLIWYFWNTFIKGAIEYIGLSLLTSMPLHWASSGRKSVAINSACSSMGPSFAHKTKPRTCVCEKQKRKSTERVTSKNENKYFF